MVFRKAGKSDAETVLALYRAVIGTPYCTWDESYPGEEEISEQTQESVMDLLHAHFRPEFLNRLDEIILFTPLTKENIAGIIDLIIADLNKRLADRQITIKLTDAAKEFVADAAYDPSYGARPIKRYIQKHVETLSAKLILQDKADEGDTIVIDVADGALTAYIG